MYARALDDAAERLVELRRAQWDGLGLGAAAFALAVLATWVVPSLAVPLLLGGLAVGAGGVRALWKRWDLVDRLAGERDAYVISEVREYACRETTIARRRDLAITARLRLSLADDATADELEALACELEDSGLELEPVCALECARLLNEPVLPPEDLRSHVRRIRSGFHPAPASALLRAPAPTQGAEMRAASMSDERAFVTTSEGMTLASQNAELGDPGACRRR
jgi:hypothetical protein